MLPPSPPEYLSGMPRCHILDFDEWGVSSTAIAKENLSDLRKYALSMELIIDNQEQSELLALNQEANALEKEDKENLLAQHYPVHWDQVVRSRFRASIIIALVSLIETSLSDVARDVGYITQEELSLSALKGSNIERCKKYLSRFDRLSISNATWEEIKNILEIRNALTHADSQISKCKHPTKVRKIISKTPGLKETCGTIFIARPYLEYCFEHTQTLLSFLSKNIHTVCAHRTRLESIQEDKN